MRCINCGNEVEESAQYCPYCRARLSRPDEDYEERTSDRTGEETTTGGRRADSYDFRWEQDVRSRTYATSRRNLTEDDLPPELKPMGAWAYVGWGILFAIPVVGFILLIIFSFSDGNVNRKHFARSYWAWFLISLIIFAILIIAGIVTAGSLASWIQNLQDNLNNINSIHIRLY